MTLGKVVVLAIIGCLAAILFALSQPVHAGECTSFDRQIGVFRSANANVWVVPWARVPKVVKDVERDTGETFKGVKRVFLVILPTRIIVGLEVGACLLDPIYITLKPDIGTRA